MDAMVDTDNTSLTRQQTVMLTVAGVLSLVVLADKVVFRIPLLMKVVHHQAPSEVTNVTLSVALRFGLWITAALVALYYLVAASGRTGAGLGATRSRNVWVFGHYLSTFLLIQILATVLFKVVAVNVFPSVSSWTGASPMESGLWQRMLDASMAGIVEEIIVIAVAFRLLECITMRIRGRRFVDTGWATAILITLRLSYHCYLGAALPIIGLFAWLSIRLYRRHRALLPMIAGHIIWDFSTDQSKYFVFAAGACIVLASGQPLGVTKPFSAR